MQLQYDIDKKAIGKRLQNERLRQGYTQEKLSEIIGVTMKYLSKVENGAASPSLPFVLKFSEVTGTDLNFLLRGINNSCAEYAGIVIEETPIYDAYERGVSKKNCKICYEIMKRILDVLQEYNS